MEQPEQVDIMRLYNSSQASLIQYMIKMRVIDTAEDYVNDGYAEAFSLLASGSLRVPKTVGWQELQNKVRGMISGTINKVSSIF